MSITLCYGLMEDGTWYQQNLSHLCDVVYISKEFVCFDGEFPEFSEGSQNLKEYTKNVPFDMGGT